MTARTLDRADYRVDTLVGVERYRCPECGLIGAADDARAAGTTDVGIHQTALDYVHVHGDRPTPNQRRRGSWEYRTITLYRQTCGRCHHAWLIEHDWDSTNGRRVYAVDEPAYQRYRAARRALVDEAIADQKARHAAPERAD